MTKFFDSINEFPSNNWAKKIMDKMFVNNETLAANYSLELINFFNNPLKV